MAGPPATRAWGRVSWIALRRSARRPGRRRLVRPVQRDEILDYATYTDHRPEIRARVLETKRLRRYQVGDFLCLMFDSARHIKPRRTRFRRWMSCSWP